MTVRIQDTARNTLPGWTINAVRGRYARGAVVSPFASPVQANGYKQSVRQVIQRISDIGGSVWVDPSTHMLQAPGVGDFRYYREWDFWAGAPGVLTTADEKRDHVRRVYAVQEALEVPLVAPTLLLNSPQSPGSQAAAALAEIAREEARGRHVLMPIVGDTHFWGSGAELDAYVGLLDQLEPSAWLLTVSRPDSTVPAAVQAAEVFGLMRTSAALSQDKPVLVGHGDLAGLPAIAAGATGLGTGWDTRQRVLAYSDHAARAAGGSGGAWYKRPTLEGLLGNLLPSELQVLVNQDAALAARLVPGAVLDLAEPAFRHHATVLTNVVDELKTLAGRDRAQRLRERYLAARMDWPRVQAITGCASGADRWVNPLLAGLEQFMTAEGWRL